MDLRQMKNKIAVGCIISCIMVFAAFQIIKMLPILNNAYNNLLLSFQTVTLCIGFAVTLFIVFGYSWLAYIMTFFAYIGVMGTVRRILLDNHIYANNLTRLTMWGIALILTFLTFYILKKLKVNMPKKEERPDVIDMRRHKGGVPE